MAMQTSPTSTKLIIALLTQPQTVWRILITRDKPLGRARTIHRRRRKQLLLLLTFQCLILVERQNQIHGLIRTTVSWAVQSAARLTSSPKTLGIVLLATPLLSAPDCMAATSISRV